MKKFIENEYDLLKPYRYERDHVLNLDDSDSSINETFWLFWMYEYVNKQINQYFWGDVIVLIW